MKEVWFGREEPGITLIIEDIDYRSAEKRNRKIFLTVVEILLSAKKIHKPYAIYYVSLSSHTLGIRAAFVLKGGT